MPRILEPSLEYRGAPWVAGECSGEARRARDQCLGTLGADTRLAGTAFRGALIRLAGVVGPAFEPGRLQ
jgi:hypothetical protein